MLKLLAHNVLNVQTILKLYLIAFNIINTIQIFFVCLQLNHGSQLAQSLLVHIFIYLSTFGGILQTLSPFNFQLFFNFLIDFLSHCVFENFEFALRCFKILLDIISDFSDIFDLVIKFIVQLHVFRLHRDG